MKRKTKKKMLDYLCGTLALVSFLLLLGVTGNCENFDITISQYLSQAIPLLAVFVITTWRFRYR